MIIIFFCEGHKIDGIKWHLNKTAPGIAHIIFRDGRGARKTEVAEVEKQRSLPACHLLFFFDGQQGEAFSSLFYYGWSKNGLSV